MYLPPWVPSALLRAPDFSWLACLLGQASFQRANVLMSMERYGEALVELEVVRDNVPKESAVYFLMGKVMIDALCGGGRQTALSSPSCP